MKKYLPLLLLPFFSVSCLADEQTRQVQAALSEAGFYYGTADGQMGEETRAALRRFQIRNGLDVSGSMTPETLAALKLKKKETRSVASEDEAQVAATAKNPDAFLAPQSRRPAPTPPPRSPVRESFADTDLAESTSRDQSATLLNAQRKLLQLGYYKSAPNGLSGPETETALLRFQHAMHLRLTGTLDSDTREALFDTPPPVPTKPFRASKNRPPGTVLRGVWVQ
ncbi:MAG: peptidoglycan-binding domain-containing protein [Chthoniobacterales bacterium]